jgi:hypothetical protein
MPAPLFQAPPLLLPPEIGLSDPLGLENRFLYAIVVYLSIIALFVEV